MSIQYVDDALKYFSRLLPLLDVPSSSDVDEAILLASDEGRLRFVDAVLNFVVNEQYGIQDAIALGALRAIIDPAATTLPYSIVCENAPAELRSSVLGKMRDLFARVFFQRCERVIAHLGTAPLSPWNELCFMWWELLPRHGVPSMPSLAETDRMIVELMGDILSIDHVACKEAALHGLALWQPSKPSEVDVAIARVAAMLPQALREYALKAQEGNLQ